MSNVDERRMRGRPRGRWRDMVEEYITWKGGVFLGGDRVVWRYFCHVHPEKLDKASEQ